MKKTLLAIVVAFSFSINSYSQTADNEMNAVLEYQTGTWCQWCPCAHSIIDGILSNYPNTVVIAYHGSGSDPWIAPSAGIRPQFGWTGYPQGTVGRKSGNLDRSAWNNQVVLSSFSNPGAKIEITNHVYNSATRTVTCNVNLTARDHLDGDFYVNYILTEDNITYTQTGNGSCAGASAYHHEHVVKAMMNGDMGESVINTHWMMNQTITKQLSYVLPLDVVPENCKINIFVYKQGTTISTNYNIQQAISFPALTTTGVGNNNTFVADYKLSQNYPNPFNPVTNIEFSIPKDGNVSFKVFDMLGNEVANVINEFRKSGSYSVVFDGASLASGIYYYKLESNNFSETKKMMLIK